MSNHLFFKVFLLGLSCALCKFAKADELPLALSQPLTIQWRFKTSDTASFTPASQSDFIYLPLAEGKLVSLHVSNGALSWQMDIGGEFSASSVVDENRIYVATELVKFDKKEQPFSAKGAIRALGSLTGVTLWMRTLQYPIRGALALNQTMLFGGSSDGRLYAINKNTGEILWITQYAAPFSSQPILNGKRLYIGSDDGTLLSIDHSTGQTLWRYRTHGALHGAVAIKDQTIFVGSADGNVYALNEVDGRLRWRIHIGAGIQSVILTNNGLLVASLDNFVYNLSTHRGERLWKRQLPGRIAIQPLLDSESALFAPLSSSTCIVLATHDGKQLNRLEIGEDNEVVASPIFAKNYLLIPTRLGLLAFAPPHPSEQSTLH